MKKKLKNDMFNHEEKLNDALKKLDELTNTKFGDFVKDYKKDFYDKQQNNYSYEKENSSKNNRNRDYYFKEDKPIFMIVLDTIFELGSKVSITVFKLIKKIFFTQSGGEGNNNNKPPILKGITDMFNFNISTKTKTFLALLFLIIITSPFILGVNDAGNRTVIQYPTGTTKVKFSPGIYTKWFGKHTVYNDIITFDFDKKKNPENATLEQIGIPVRYQDGGMGTTFGIIRFGLPNDEESMILIHKDFKSNDGLANKLLKAIAEESMNLTAGLMTSEAAYTEKRGTFSDWARTQIKKGPFVTTLGSIEVNDEQDPTQKIKKTVPVIMYGKDGKALHNPSDLEKYRVTVSGIQIVDWDFEPKTLNQIAAKREATMAIITAKATAERAKQDSITAEQEGLAEVMKARYKEKVEKEKAVVKAEKLKEVAIITAQQGVEVAKQKKLEALENKLAALEYEKTQEAKGRGDSAYSRMVMEADGALRQKLDAYVKVNDRYARSIEAHKMVPDIQFGGGSNGADNGGSTAAANFINMLQVKTAKDLMLDLNMGQAKK